MLPVNSTIPLPVPPGRQDPYSLQRFDIDVTKAIKRYMVEVATRLNGVLPKDGSEPFEGNLNITGDITQTGNLAVTGNTVLTGNLNVTGTTTLATTNIVGVTTMTGNVNMTGVLDVTGNIDVSADMLVGDDLTVTGDTTLNGPMAFNDNIVQVGNYDLTGDFTLDGELSVDGEIGLTGNFIQVGNADITGTLDLSGLATVGALTSTGIITTNGQVAFPATQNQSNDANVLDDYEEGSFTPTVTFDTPGTMSVSYAVQSGSYTKIGRLVFIRVGLNFTPTLGTATGNFRVESLPFTSMNSSTSPGTLTLSNVNASFVWPAGTTMVAGAVVANATYFVLTGRGSAVTGGNFTQANLTSGAAHVIVGSGVYMSAL